MKKIKIILTTIVMALLVVCFADVIGFSLESVPAIGEPLSAINNFLGFDVSGLILAVPVIIPGATTTEEIEALLDNDLSRDIVKMRPQATPIDTLMRNIKNHRGVVAWKTGCWEVGVREVYDKVTALSTAGAQANLLVEQPVLWQVNDTLSVEGQTGADGKNLVLFVYALDIPNKAISVIAVNEGSTTVPALAADTQLLRLSNVVGETDAQAVASNLMPEDRFNYCQLHMAQVEESIVSSMHKKIVDGYDFGLQKDQALFEFKRRMELSNFFGVRNTFQHPITRKVLYTSDGLMNQIKKQLDWNPTDGWNQAKYINFTRDIFEGNNGSETRIVLAAPELIAAMSMVPDYSKQMTQRDPKIVHGVKFSEIVTNFGTLLVKSVGSILTGVHAGDGLVLDLNHIRKDVFEHMQETQLDLDKTGQSRVKATRILESYCLIAENLDTHAIIKKVA